MTDSLSDAPFNIKMLRLAADEIRGDATNPQTHRLLSFWQAQNAVERLHDNGEVRRDPNVGKQIPYDQNVKYWLWALGTQKQVADFHAVGGIITHDMTETQQQTMNDFIANLQTDVLRDTDALEQIYAKTAQVFDARA